MNTKMRVILATAAATSIALASLVGLPAPVSAAANGVSAQAAEICVSGVWCHYDTYETVDACKRQAKLWKDVGWNAECRSTELWLLRP